MIDESKAPERPDDGTEEDVAETGSDAPDAPDEGGTPPTLTFAIRAVGVAALVMTVTAALAFDLRAALGTLLGGILATANLWLFVRIAGAFLAQKGRAAPWVMLGGIKLLALFFCMFILIRRGDVSALALAAGYGALPIGITISTLFRKPEA